VLSNAFDDAAQIRFRIETADLRRLCCPQDYAEQARFPQDPSRSAYDWLGIICPVPPLSTAENRTMVAAEYLSRSRLFRRLKSGPRGQLVELYAARLVKDGLVRHGTWRCLNLVGGLLSWIASGRWKLADLDERMVERYLQYRAGNQSIQPGDRAALKRLLSVMRDTGTIAPAALPPITPPEQIFSGSSATICGGNAVWRRSLSSATSR
jgi:hypothetical protein